MADDQPPAPPKKKKLPSLTATTENETDGVKKVVKKKKKKPVDEESAETTPKTTDGTPRKKKKPVTTQHENGEAPASLDTGTTPAATPRKKKKKVVKKSDTDETEPKSSRSTDDISQQGEDVTGSKKSLITKEGTPKKKVKKKVKKSTTTTAETRDSDDLLDATFAGDLTAIQEDIVSPRERTDGDGQEVEEEEEEGETRKPYSTESAVLKSQPLQKIFIETDSGFKGEKRSKLEKRIAEEQQFKSQIVPEATRSTIDFAISTHKFFGTVCLFLHGLTAGISMWQITIVYVLLYFDNYDFISHYQVMALPVQCMFYILLVLCTVSACDRFDISNINRRFLIHSISMQTGTVSVIIYLASLIVSLCTANLEDKINIYGTNTTAWGNDQNVANDVSLWRDLNTARCVLAILGWIVIAIGPNTDRLTDSLRKADDNIMGNSLELNSHA